MDLDTDRVIARPDDLTASWLAATIGAEVTDFSVARIGHFGFFRENPGLRLWPRFLVQEFTPDG